MKVNQNCVGCAQCAAYCPHNAITVFGRASINRNCVECKTCVDYCPLGAISGDE
ncbi:MAG: 4Fe-4S binding protein [Candidatus Methanoperedens sp.]|nr:4Fe-4S binding protein [Candidatus Methanoperedens sp.]PKL54388.1 MAG: ferredoxin [Candidatus Methanoperedenaceae archaeon HGW-Methanoperedenaceae-1]